MMWYAFLAIYATIALGAAIGTVPREFFKRPVERLVVRVSCGLMWPLLLGYLLARASTVEVKREEMKTLQARSHTFDPIHNGADECDECECGLVRSAPVHY